MPPGVSRRTGTREAIRTRTLGQPWLVNALAYETLERKAGRDRSHAITADDVAEAREALIVRRVTHLDQMAGQAAGRPGAPGRRADAQRAGESHRLSTRSG